MPLDRNTELSHLNEANAHIASAEKRVARQAAIVDELRRDGHNTIEGERLLRGFKETLEAMREHRSAIVDTLANIDAGLI